MPENWVKVGLAVRKRLTELELSQTELIRRSQVSKATVGEIVHGAVWRNRSVRTLQALSEALEWHTDHLQSVLMGAKPPPMAGDRAHDEPSRLAAIELTLRRIEQRLTEISTGLDGIFKA
jgi:transcriptional regulator with XRE-family HTH domain